MILYLDLETFSDVEIKKGTSRYCEGALEILLTAYAVDDGAVQVEEGYPDRVADLAEQADRIVIHNSKFDRTVCETLGIDMPIAKIHDTLVQARSHGLPGGLGILCEVLKVPTDKAKDKRGRELIHLFCKPRPKNSELRRATKLTHPDQWAEFIEYAALDIEAMREVYKRLPKWNYGNPSPPNQSLSERDLWLLDQKINDRGFKVDVDLATAAIDAVETEKRHLARRVNTMTGGEVEAATQRDKLLEHLLEWYGVKLPDMQKGTLERRLLDENIPDPVKELIAIRLEASTTSTSKYRTLLDTVSADGRLRGTLEFCGASRTGRWGGRLFQPQNLPRPKHDRETLEDFVEALKAGCYDLLFDDVIAHCSSAIRGCLVAPNGKKLVAADLSNIEGRVLAWLAGEEWKLQAFRDYDAGTGPDLYKMTAGSILGKAPEDVTKDERQSTGKVPELACGYQGAVGAFASMARLYGLDLPEEEVLAIVKAWRRANRNITRFWYELEQAAIGAVETPGVTREVGLLKVRRDGAWLKIVLPSGRALVYPQPKLGHRKGPCRLCGGLGEVEEVKCSECNGTGETYGRLQLNYSGVDPYTKQWARIWTYGGKLVENVVQAVARDVLADAMPRAEASGYEIVLTVHDEIVTETTTGTAEGLSAIMSTNPPWAEGLPLSAAGFSALRYGKE